MKKIICFRNSKLGDYLISIPALKLIKDKNPKSKLYFLCAKNNYFLNLPKKIEKQKIVDEFIFYDHSFLNLLKLIKFLKSKKFNKIYYIQEKPNLYRETRDYLYFRFLGIPKLHGFFEKRLDYVSFSETFQVAKRIDKNISKNKILKLIQFKNKIDQPIYKFKYITISIGGFSQPKVWDIKNWSTLIQLISKNHRYKIIILGTKNDIRNSNFLMRQNKKSILSLCGKTNINQLLNIIKFSKVHITNDNGSMHAATLFQKKTLCLFNNHDPIGKWYPENKNSKILRPANGINSINPYKVYRILAKLF